MLSVHALLKSHVSHVSHVFQCPRLEAGDLHRDDSAHFVLSGSVVLLAELHDVETLLANVQRVSVQILACALP